LYAYRHTYAQRHADAGVPVDVLRELMDHRLLDATRRYYRNPRVMHQAGEKPQVSWSALVPNWFRSSMADAC
jgi:integrase